MPNPHPKDLVDLPEGIFIYNHYCLRKMTIHLIPAQTMVSKCDLDMSVSKPRNLNQFFQLGKQITDIHPTYQ